MTLARWLAIVPAAAAALAQSTPAPASIAGTVTNSVTGEPILRAHVTAHCMSEDRHDGQQVYYGALTNSKGEFSIAPLPSGNCALEVQRVGFVALNFASQPVSSGAHKEGVKLTLVPTGAITGRVLSSTGEPAQGVIVYAELTSDNSMNATVDDKGQFRIGGLRPGKYRVKAIRESLPFPPEIRADGSREMRDATTYYPDSLNAKTAQRLEVKAGAEVSGVEIKLVQTPIVEVSGKITGIPPGTKNIGVNIQPSGPGTSIKADGTFSMWRVDPGKYTLQAQQWTGQAQLQSAPLDIEVTTANLEHLELRMIPPFDIAGQVRFDDDQAREPLQPPRRPDGKSPPAPHPPPRNVSLQPMSHQGPSFSNVSLEPDDRFTVTSVQPQRYRVELNGMSGFVKAVRVGDTETDGDILDLRNGSPGPITITVSSHFCEVSGTVSDSKGPVADVSVILSSVEDGSNSHVGSSNASGGYSFRVPPGKYLLAVIDAEQFNWGMQGPDLEDYEPLKLDLSAGDKITKDLTTRK